MSTALPRTLAIGLPQEIERILGDLLKNAVVSRVPLDLDRLMEPTNDPPGLVLVGPAPADIPAMEIAQMLRMQFPDSPIHYCCLSREGFERKLLIKNGFTDAWLLPLDTENFRTAVSEILAKASSGSFRVYRPVKIIDLEAGDTLDFETAIYLPANKKYVKLSAAGDTLEASRIERIKRSKFTSIQVPADQIKLFYEYSANRLRKLGAGDMSVTEKREKLTGAIRDLLSGLFTEETASFESGAEIMKDCGEIVNAYILQGAESEWFCRIQTVLGERGDSYSHSANVSTLAALFSMGLGIGKPEDMALAGLLHDIGISELPAEIQALDPEKMTPAQFEIYKTHPERSLKLIRSRKIIIPDSVAKAVLQHHELYNGSGYPSGLFGDRISKEAQILSLADTFDYLTRVREGKPLLTPQQAVDRLRTLQVNDPSRIHYAPELLKKLVTLFPSQTLSPPAHL
jgi:HD-GYP domain-containing protein (c-di-GMP phosphodiesterase class II)